MPTQFSVSIFKFGSGVCVLLFRLWKINVFLKSVSESKKKERTFPAEVVLKGKSLSSGDSQNDDCFAEPGKGLVSP